MKIGIVVAMEEEFTALSTLFNSKKLIDDVYKTYIYQYENLEVIGTISKIGKAAASSATTYLINRYDPDFLINIGSCGGVNKAEVASVILSNKAGYADVDVTAFGYKLGQMAQQPEYFISRNQVVNFEELFTHVNSVEKVLTGMVITSDSFIADKAKVNEIKNIYPDTIATEMEAAAFAQICTLFNKDFLLVKKVSDMADQEASNSFKEEIAKISEKTSHIIKAIFDYYSK